MLLSLPIDKTFQENKADSDSLSQSASSMDHDHKPDNIDNKSDGAVESIVSINNSTFGCEQIEEDKCGLLENDALNNESGFVSEISVFQYEPSLRHNNLISGCCLLLAVILLSSTVTFAQAATLSNPPCAGLHVLNTTNNLILLDASSAFFVLSGFTAAVVFSAHTNPHTQNKMTEKAQSTQEKTKESEQPESWTQYEDDGEGDRNLPGQTESSPVTPASHEISSDFLKCWYREILGLYALVVVGMVVSLIVWPGMTIPRNRKILHMKDVAVSVLESTIGLRFLETDQSYESWHTINTTAWPVHCLILSGFWLPNSFRLAVALRKKNNSLGFILPASVISGIVVSTTLAVVNNKSNLFFAMATGSVYRLLEALLGMHFAVMILDAAPESPLMLAGQSLRFWPFAVFGVLWWVEIGARPMENRETCLRIYYFDNCIQDAQGGLARGCVLGILLSLYLFATDSVVHHHICLPRVQVLLATVVFAWPVSHVTLASLYSSLSEPVANANGPLLAIMCALNGLGAGYLYDVFAASVVTDATAALTLRAYYELENLRLRHWTPNFWLARLWSRKFTY